METTKICEHLAPIYKLELAQGNEMIWINADVWEQSPYQMGFRYPINRALIDNKLILSDCVEYYENHDSHYPIVMGYRCVKCGHTIAGLQKRGEVND